MCGIAGYLHLEKERIADPSVVRRMTTRIAHRGPDGEGFYVKDNLALGHRRLAIIDLSTGDQPMITDDGNLVIIFNGEIYNYLELKQELLTLGHTFRTQSDTEVILKAYQQWGNDFQNKLNGMWAFALWDHRNATMLLSRDRLGEKPLYYAIHDNTVIFGSELKCILEYGIVAQPDFELTELYFCLSFIPAPYTFYKGIKKLEAGHFLRVKGDRITESKYWEIEPVREGDLIRDKKKVYQVFEETLYDSVKIRMRSDVSFGAFLSGGLDSAAVLALMSRSSKIPVETFTIGFHQKEFDERALAQAVATQFGSNHHEHLVEPEAFEESIHHVLRHFDEPFGDSSAIPTGYVSKYAAQHVKMVLTGDGGDEVLSGYPSYQGEKFAQLYGRLPGPMQAGMPALAKGISHVFTGATRYKVNRVARVLASSGLSFEKRLISKMWATPELVDQLLTQPERRIGISDFLNDFWSRFPAKDPFYRLMYYHLKVVLPDDYLVKVDRMSMSYSLETRVPFLDYRLVEFMTRVDRRVKMERFTRKSVLRNTIGQALPKALLRAPKKGFGVPLREWFKKDSFDEKMQSLSKGDFGLDTEVLKGLVAANKQGKQDLGNFLWMILVYKQWLSNQ